MEAAVSPLEFTSVVAASHSCDSMIQIGNPSTGNPNREMIMVSAMAPPLGTEDMATELHTATKNANAISEIPFSGRLNT